MAFDKEEIQQLESLFTLQERRLQTIIRDELDEINDRLDRLFKTES
jgi:hypothetical protein